MAVADAYAGHIHRRNPYSANYAERQRQVFDGYGNAADMRAAPAPDPNVIDAEFVVVSDKALPAPE